jgi:hypothetical protein
LDALSRLDDRKKVVWACVNIKHTEMVATELRAQAENVSVIHSKLGKALVDTNKERFESGDSRHVVSVSMLTTGIDIPAIDSIVLMRPIKSSTLMVQLVGRGLRPAKDKVDCTVLDYGSVFANCGPVDDPYVVDKGKKKSKKTLVKVCKNCAAIVPISLKVCDQCGFEFISEARDPVKNLTKKAQPGAILSKDVKNDLERIEVRPYVVIKRVTTQKGKDALVVEYVPKNLFRGPIKEWALSDQPWSINTVFGKLGLNVWKWEQAVWKVGRQELGISAIHVTKDQYPKVKRIERI